MAAPKKSPAKKAVPNAVPADASGMPSGGFVITGKLYDTINFVVRVVLPALGALYFGLAALWGLPNAEEVVGSVAVINVFFGSVLHLSASNFKKSDGDVDAYVPPGTFAADFPGQDKVTFKVDHSLSK